MNQDLPDASLNEKLIRNASLILNVDGVLIGFLMLIISGKNLNQYGNFTVLNMPIMSIPMYFAFCFLVGSFISALLIALDVHYLGDFGSLMFASVIGLILGLLCIVVFAFETINAALMGFLVVIATIILFIGIYFINKKKNHLN